MLFLAAIPTAIELTGHGTTATLISTLVLFGLIAAASPVLMKIPGIRWIVKTFKKIVAKPVADAVRDSVREDVLAPIVRDEINKALEPIVQQLKVQFGGNGGGIRQAVDEISTRLANVEATITDISERESETAAKVKKYHPE